MDYKSYVGERLRNFDKVMLVSDGYKAVLNQAILNRVELGGKEVLIVTAGQYDVEQEEILCETVSEEFAEQLRRLYHTYEFADNFIVLEQSPIFATIFSYVQTGILTLEEAWRALLGE